MITRRLCCLHPLHMMIVSNRLIVTSLIVREFIISVAYPPFIQRKYKVIIEFEINFHNN